MFLSKLLRKQFIQGRDRLLCDNITYHTQSSPEDELKPHLFNGVEGGMVGTDKIPNDHLVFRTVEKSQTNATCVTLLPFKQVI